MHDTNLQMMGMHLLNTVLIKLYSPSQNIFDQMDALEAVCMSYNAVVHL